jgi:PAS domain S-box-containing protein
MSITEPNSAQISLLCVDDDIWILDALKKYFEQEPDITLQTSTSAMEALDLMNSQHFDAIICDYSMPDMDGIALLREIRSRGDDALFIIFTGRRLAHVAIETLNSGGNYYLQKGIDVISEIPKVVGYIRSHVHIGQETNTHLPSDSPYRSLVENQFDPVACFDRDGHYLYTNRSYKRDIEHGKTDDGENSFFSTIPDDERNELVSHLKSLSVINPNTHIEHHIRTNEGSLKLYLWNYRAITDNSGEITGYTGQGTDLSGIIHLSLPVIESSAEQVIEQKPAGTLVPSAEPEILAPVKQIKTLKNLFADLADAVEYVQYPIFAIDRAGMIIAWNQAIAELTGVESADMLGKGEHAYAVTLYGDKRTMLIDYIFDPPDEQELKKMHGITRDGDSFTGDLETVTIHGKSVLLWSKGGAIFDQDGSMIAAVQSILVSTEPSDNTGESVAEEEVYIGGISSIILKVTGRGMGGAIAGAIGSAVGGYGVYATNKRLFVIHNPTLDARRNDSLQFGTFIIDELFGNSVDIRPRLIAELESQKVFEVWRKDITSIELKKPRLLAGFLVINTINGGSFRVYVDHNKAFLHLEHLIMMFYPELLQKTIPGAGETDLMWIDEIHSFDLVGNFSIEDPFEDIGSTTHHIPVSQKAVPKPVARPVIVTPQEWDDLAKAVSSVPYPIFAIDRRGRVIAWNRAIEKLTGIPAQDMMGREDHAYAVPFYGEARSMLIDYIVMPPDAHVNGDIPSITRDGDTFIGDLENVTIRDKPMVMWGKGTGIHDAKGFTIAAIQSILVSEPPTVKTILGMFEQEKYIGGISSITVKLGGEGMSGSIAGALGSTTGGYGVYATDQRLFVILNPDLDATRSDGITFGTFIIDELFGTTVDTRPRLIEELEDHKVIEIWRRDITSIEMKKPMLLAGHIIFRTRTGEAFRIYIDHQKAFTHIDQLLRLFYPEILRIE